MVAAKFDADEIEEVEPVPIRKTLLQLVLVSAVLAVVVIGVVAGGAVALSRLLPSVDSSGGYCNPITDHCTNNYNLVAVETQTGYTFPEGSVLLESGSYGGTLRYPQERSMGASVQMPPGSPIPTSKDPLSSIYEQGVDSEQNVIVHVSTSNGEGWRHG